LCINILTITIKITQCPRGEIGRHKGLKILALMGVPVRVWPRAPLIMNKLIIVSDKNSKSKQIKKQLLQILKKEDINISNIVIVIGGDGFMLQTLKNNKYSNKYFYGINSGNYGFLMNKFSKKFIIKNLHKSKLITISPLEMSVSNKNSTRKCLAINEVSILRQSRQAANLSIKNNSKHIIKQLVSDGVLVSTPAGSTAYNLSVHGPILSLNSKKISIAPISPFRPRRWKGKIVSDKSKIIITNLNSIKRPISAVADNVEVRNAKKIIIKIQKKIKFNLLYDTSSSLQKKIKLEQLRREVN
jgi:NAD+ kinase